MRFLLINPRCAVTKNEVTLPPLGLSMISAVLKQNNYFVKGLNLDYTDFNTSLKDIVLKYIKDFNIDVVAVGSLSNEYNQTKQIFDIVKEYNSNILTILGGGILNYDVQTVFESLENLDIGVIGEGELTIVRLADTLKNTNLLHEIDGIIFRENRKTKFTKPVALINDLDTLPYPDFDEFNIDRFLDLQLPTTDYKYYQKDNPRLLTLFASRSCPYACTFCSHTIGKKYRSFSLDYFFKMLDFMIEKYSINILQIIDELFSLKKEKLIEFCERIKKYDLIWYAQTRVDEVDKDILTIMRDSGCYFMSYGIEHINKTVLKSMKKKIKVADIENTLKLTYDLNMGIQGNILIGDIAETEESFHDVVSWLLENKKYQLNFTPLLVYPGTKIYDYAKEKEIIPDTIDFLKQDLSSKIINLTKFKDIQFKDMCDLRFEIFKYIKVYGELLEVEYTTTDKYNRLLNKVKTKCGHCHKNNVYNNFHLNASMMAGNTFKMGCKHCNQKYDLVLNKFYTYYKNKVQKHINDFIKQDIPIYLVGCKDSEFIIKEFEFLGINLQKINFKKFFDSDKNKIGQSYLNQKIIEDYHATSFSNRDKDIIFMVPAYRKEDKSLQLKEDLLKYGINEGSIYMIDRLSLFTPMNHYLDKRLFKMVRD
jgi:radical SAM superfamily enzyme YgiQ (UPF0313 family)